MNIESYIFAAAGFVTFFDELEAPVFLSIGDIRPDHDRQWFADTIVRSLGAMSLVRRRTNRLLSDPEPPVAAARLREAIIPTTHQTSSM